MGSKQSVKNEKKFSSTVSNTLYSTCIQRFETNMQQYARAVNNAQLGKVVIMGDGNRITKSIIQDAKAANYLAAKDTISMLVNSTADAQSMADVMAELRNAATQKGGFMAENKSSNSDIVDLRVENKVVQYNEITKIVNIINSAIAENNFSDDGIDIIGNKNDYDLSVDQKASAINDLVNTTFASLGVDAAVKAKSETKSRSDMTAQGDQKGTIPAVTDSVTDLWGNFFSTPKYIAYAIIAVIALVILLFGGIIAIKMIGRGGNNNNNNYRGGMFEDL